VDDKPTFGYDLAMFLTRNSELANSEIVQALIEEFMYDNHWRAEQEVKK
jgi:hypothetical protein